MEQPNNAVFVIQKVLQLMKKHTRALLLNVRVQESEKLRLLIESMFPLFFLPVVN
jgi:hypothetical protein